jgi:hypothetical protein
MPVTATEATTRLGLAMIAVLYVIRSSRPPVSPGWVW